jgi:hypothetical protein
VCHRSSTSCATCFNFRHAVFGGAGYCGRDRRREPLVGDEIRACWSSPIAVVAGTASVGAQGSIDEQPFGPGEAIASFSATSDPLEADRPGTFWVEVEA